MSADVEEYVRHIFTNSEVPARDLAPAEVVAIGYRVRRVRRRRTALAGLAATGLVAFGVAQIVVPASGTPLTPLVWAAGEGRPGSEAGTWVIGNGHRFVISIRDAYFGDRNAVVFSDLNPDGSEQVTAAHGPLRPEDLPAVGFASSSEPGVSFGIFPAGAHNFTATDERTSDACSISTMKISSPHGGPDYVAVAMDSGRNSNDSGRLVMTWVDAEGQAQRWPATP